jgi:hypothetical protein
MSEPAESRFGIREIVSHLLDFLYPPCCQVCGKNFAGDSIWLCDECRAGLSELSAPVCPVCRSYLESPGDCFLCGKNRRIIWL